MRHVHVHGFLLTFLDDIAIKMILIIIIWYLILELSKRHIYCDVVGRVVFNFWFFVFFYTYLYFCCLLVEFNWL